MTSNAHPALTGRALQGKLWDARVINEDALATESRFDLHVAGPGLPERRDVDRCEEGVLQDYKEGVIRDGVLRGVRSDAGAIASSGAAPFPGLARAREGRGVSGAAFAEAAREAVEEKSDEECEEHAKSNEESDQSPTQSDEEQK